MFKILFTSLCLTASSMALADVTVPMYFTTPTGVGQLAGTVVISETKNGLLFTPHLQGLSPQLHGFHIHQMPACENNGMAAGGHFDPLNTGQHLGPYNNAGHLGDLPALTVAADGSATVAVVAPRLMHLDAIKNHALMVHEGGDNYADVPAKLGGGGARMICGVIGAS